MKYVNANEVLPEKLLTMIQKYYQGGYLYIPMENHCKTKQKTDYKIELEKRNQYIYLKHLEGRTNGQLGNTYHLSESSIRRIIFKEKGRYRKMQELIKQILPLWGIEIKQLSQMYPSTWQINDSYVIKIYRDKNQLERNIKILTILSECTIPVAKIVLTAAEEKYAKCQNAYFFLSKKIQGNNISDKKDETMAWKMGYAIARLHMAFLKCEKEIEFWDNSLLKEMKGWIRETLTESDWQIIDRTEYSETVERLENVYDFLPKQLIHRDVHFGNFLFQEGDFSGYIDFDLSQKNIRIFDICYFLAGLLAEETETPLTKSEWIQIAKSAIAGYESIAKLSEKEIDAIPLVMECIKILFVAYFIGKEDIKHANDAYQVFRFIRNCEYSLFAKSCR